MKNHLLVLFVVAALLVAASCTYTLPDEEFFKEIDTTGVVSTISLNNYNNLDTIYIYQSTNFDFNVGINKGLINEVRVLLNDDPFMVSNSEKGKIFINPRNLGTGVYDLRIEFTASSGTGSLADKFNAEYRQVWKRWILKIDIDPPPNPTLTASSSNGFLKISWDAFLKKSFVSYTLSVNEPTGGYRTIEIKDPLKTFWYDSNYVGGYRATYSIAINTQNASSYGGILVNDSQELTVTAHSADSSVILTWRKTRFSDALKEIVISENETVRNKITSSTDTTFTLKLKEAIFGISQSKIKFEIIPKYSRYAPHVETLYIRNPLGFNTISNDIEVYFNKNRSSLYIHKKILGRLCRYNVNMMPLDSMTGLSANFALPYSGNHIYLGGDKTITQVNLFTQEIGIVTITDHRGSIIGPSNISAAGNQRFSYDYIDPTPAWDKIYHRHIYDLSTGNLIDQMQVGYDVTSYLRPFILADDGRFAFETTSRNIYRVNTTNIDLIGQLPYVGIFHSFRQDNPDEIIMNQSDGTVTICKSDDLTILRTISPPASGYSIKNYDPVSKNILFANFAAREVYIVNIDTNEVHKINAAGDNYRLMAGILFNLDGFFLKVI